MKFQYFSNRVNQPRPLGYISLDRFIEATKKPKTDIFKQIAQAEIDKDFELKAKLKQENLYYFTPCVHLKNGRKYADIVSFTGLMVLDFDHIDNSEDLKYHLFNEYDFIVACWLSPSKKGIKALIQIPICKDTNEFKEYFEGITEVMEIYDGFDTTTKNCVLPLFQSVDSNILYRKESATFSVKKSIESQYHYQTKPFVKVNVSNHHLKSVYNITESAINKIMGEGHPQLRGASLALGGYVASGYISFDEAEQLMHNLIDSNSYLCQKPNAYKKTATWAINQGQKSQLFL